MSHKGTKVNNLPMYLTPSDVQTKIGISKKTLEELKGTVFIKGIHYFIPTGRKYAMWDRDALLAWVKGDNSDEISDIVNDILNIA